MLGRNFSTVVATSHRDDDAALVQRVREGEQIKSESDRVHKDGSVVPVAATMSPILDEAGAVTGIAAIEQDVTQPRARAAALAEAREKALETSRMKSEFLATMSHEIRTPMNGVIGLTGLLLTTPLNATQRQYAHGVRDAGEALLTVINDILDFSKLEAGKVQLEVADFDVRRLVEDVAALLAPSAHAKQLELVAYCVPELPQCLRGDAGRVRQILLNLASNAIKFTAQGEVTIKVRSVDSGDGPAVVRFEVRDTGIGVTAHDRDRLFESFSQADASTTRRYGGTGLGLAISTSLTTAMGGDIGVDSAEGTGSTFWFAIPLEIAANVEEAPPAANIGLLTGLRTVIVDDNATNRLVLETQLTAWGLSADVVADAQSALVRIRAAALEGRPYGLAVLDMCMPGMDGLELVQRIRGDSTLDNDLKLMMLTSSMAVEGVELKAAGVDEWLTKPVRSSDLYDRIIHLMTPSAPPIRLAPSTPSARRTTSTSRGLVLVVEDNTLNQLVAEGILGSLGYDVDIVDNGFEALAAVEAKTYAAVLMDCHMPVMDGYAATEEIRRRQAGGRRTPIIAMTAGAMAEDRERCLNVGMDDYVSKPVTAEAVDAALVQWIAEPDSSAAVPGTQAPDAPAPGAPSESPIDANRQAVLRALGPDDGWGILPAAVRAFLADNQLTMSAMRAAEGSGNSEALRDAAHQLKGAAANIGAAGVAALCSELESRMRAHEPENCHELIDQLDTELERTNGLLQDALPASA
jgi:signal transduction histidine kinase/DNA-binding response OmpR family regulator/HPt (histidine-containing phosphotransfer) domain-containing protein